MAREKNDTFDLEAGMAVYAADGHRIGIVTEVAGFGNTKIPRSGDHDGTDFVIQAKTSSGYFNMDRENASSTPGAVPLCVPFHGIDDVRAGYGVTLNATIIEELARQGDPRSTPAIDPKASRGWRPKWLRS